MGSVGRGGRVKISLPSDVDDEEALEDGRRRMKKRRAARSGLGRHANSLSFSHAIVPRVESCCAVLCRAVPCCPCGRRLGSESESDQQC